MTLSHGAKLGPYVIEALLGAGDMSDVYRARDLRLGRAVAIKTLRPEAAGDSDGARRLMWEARAVSSVSHLNILELHDVGEHDGILYLVTELLEGQSLRARMAERRLKLPDVVRVATDVLHGLAAARARGVVHRDIKPSNVSVDIDGMILCVPG